MLMAVLQLTTKTWLQLQFMFLKLRMEGSRVAFSLKSSVGAFLTDAAFEQNILSVGGLR